MRCKCSIKMSSLLCGLVFFISLLDGQTNKFFENDSGLVYKLFFISKYMGAFLLTVYTLTIKRKMLKKDIKRIFKIFIPIILLMIFVEVIAYFTSPVPRIYGIRYWTRSLYIFFNRIFIILLAIDILCLCGINSIDIIAKICILDELLLFSKAWIVFGITGIVKSFFGAFAISSGSSNFFEVHELTFAIGILLIYYLFYDNERRKKIGLISMLIFFFILGSKRIGVFALIVSCIFSVILKKYNFGTRQIILLGSIGIVICYLYLFIIYNDKFFSFLNNLGVNNMGRDLIYGYYTRRTEFSPTQLGWGIAGVNKVIENMSRAEVLYMQSVRGLHNDILKIFIDYGFIGSLFWYGINLVFIPIKLFKLGGSINAKLYMSLVIYMFITYLTDNTESYYVCQVVLYLVPLLLFLKNKTHSEEKNKS